MIAETISMAPYEVSFPSKIDILVRKWVSKFWEGIPRGGGGAEKKKLSAVCAAAAGADFFQKKSQNKTRKCFRTSARCAKTRTERVFLITSDRFGFLDIDLGNTIFSPTRSMTKRCVSRYEQQCPQGY